MKTRIFDIIRILLESNDSITIQSISEIINVSNKTIRNDLNIVEKWVETQNLKLVKKTGVGVSLLGSEEDKLATYQMVQQLRNRKIDYSPQARKNYIGITLIMAEGDIRIYQLADELYVSRATIHKDLSILEEDLKQHKIKLSRKNNNGLTLFGSEKNMRAYLLQILIDDNGYSYFQKLMKTESNICDGSFVFLGLDYTDDELYELINILDSLHMTYFNSMNLEARTSVYLQIFISYIRIRDSHQINLSQSFIQELEKEPLYDVADEIASTLSDFYNVEYSHQERKYLQVFLISWQNSNSISLEDMQEAKKIQELLIKQWERLLNRDFHNDEVLKQHLLNHLGPAITRFRHNIPIDNPLLEETKQLYPETLRITSESMGAIEEYYNIHLSDDEIGYFALHLAAALERSKRPLKVYLVTHNSVGATLLLSDKLHRQLPEIDIIETHNIKSLKTVDLSRVDLVLSTIDLQLDSNTPILIINPLLYDHDITRLKKILRSHDKTINNPLDTK